MERPPELVIPSHSNSLLINSSLKNTIELSVNYTSVYCDWIETTLLPSSYTSSVPPEIVIENSLVYSGEREEATLSCTIHGETTPDVS